MTGVCTWLAAAILVSADVRAQQVTTITVDGAGGGQQVIVNRVAGPDGQVPPPPPAAGQVGFPTAPGGAPAAPPRDGALKPDPARIRGHVFASDNGAPIRRAQVRLISPALRENRLAMTDARGPREVRRAQA